MLYGGDLERNGWNSTKVRAVGRQATLEAISVLSPCFDLLIYLELLIHHSGCESAYYSYTIQVMTSAYLALLILFGSIEDELELTYKNIAAFNHALDEIGEFRTPRCCGC
jgi:hypothetical protein